MRGIVHLDRLAVEGDVDRGAARDPAAAAAAAAHAEFVFGIQRKRVLNQHAAAGAERQPLDVTVLGQPARRRIGDLARGEGAIAHGLATDLHRRGDVPLDERGRDAQRLRDVVEAFARAIRGKQRRHVHVQREQVADRVGVFGPVQPVQRGGGEVRARHRGAIETGFELRGERVEDRALGAAGAARGHHPRSDLPDDLLPRLRVSADARDVQRVERQSGGLQLLVVTRDAVLLEKRRIGRRGRPRLCRQWPANAGHDVRTCVGLTSDRRSLAAMPDRDDDATARQSPAKQSSHHLALALMLLKQRDRARFRFRRMRGEEHALRPRQRRAAFLILHVESRALVHEEPDDVVRPPVRRARGAPSAPWS